MLRTWKPRSRVNPSTWSVRTRPPTASPVEHHDVAGPPSGGARRPARPARPRPPPRHASGPSGLPSFRQLRRRSDPSRPATRLSLSNSHGRRRLSLSRNVGFRDGRWGALLQPDVGVGARRRSSTPASVELVETTRPTSVDCRTWFRDGRWAPSSTDVRAASVELVETTLRRRLSLSKPPASVELVETTRPADVVRRGFETGAGRPPQPTSAASAPSSSTCRAAWRRLSLSKPRGPSVELVETYDVVSRRARGALLNRRHRRGRPPQPTSAAYAPSSTDVIGVRALLDRRRRCTRPLQPTWRGSRRNRRGGARSSSEVWVDVSGGGSREACTSGSGSNLLGCGPPARAWSGGGASGSSGAMFTYAPAIANATRSPAASPCGTSSPGEHVLGGAELADEVDLRTVCGRARPRVWPAPHRQHGGRLVV